MTAYSYFFLGLAYFLGSIPFGLILTRIAGMGDIREIGSGNIGATNVLRTGNKKIALLTLLMDMLKGTLAVLLTIIYAPEVQGLAALAVLLGHMFPLWLKFKGGKGVATALGAFIALSPPVAFMAMGVWLAAAAILRLSSLSALISIGTMPIFLTIFEETHYLWVSAAIILLVFIKHHENIKRLIQGTEPSIGNQKTKSHEPSQAS